MSPEDCIFSGIRRGMNGRDLRLQSFAEEDLEFLWCL